MNQGFNQYLMVTNVHSVSEYIYDTNNSTQHVTCKIKHVHVTKQNLMLLPNDLKCKTIYGTVNVYSH